MRIICEFELYGFERLDMGEEGAVFVRYERRGEPAVKEQAAFIGCRDYERLVVEQPLRCATACAIVTRTSKNRYSATAYAGKRIQTFKHTSTDGLRSALEKFFEEAAA